MKTKYIAQVAELVLYSGYYRATKFVSDEFTVKATRQFKPDKRDRQESFIVTVGKPNYKERKFIALCKKAGETFPVRKIQLESF